MGELDLNDFDRGVFLINVLAVIYNPKTKKILIGRRENDPYVPELTWGWPGGRPTYDRELEDSLLDEIKKKTGLTKLEIKKVIYSRITPELERKQILIYFYCETNETKIKAGEKFVEVKWIETDEWVNYFRTSTHPKVIEFLAGLK
ncbi:MAG: NUDIX hydrolase [Candidatus Nanoarchaeia archaeon]